MDSSPATRDFTLHDHGHAFRVAERMQEIVGDRLLEQLSTYELAFLLLSAYLHDIGMAPAQKKVERHRRHILFGDDKKPEKLSEDEALAFREFYDSSDWNAPVPFAPEGGADEVAIQSANEVLTDYCRYKHNDWSEAWMRQHLNSADRNLPHYPHWLDDLILICRSHHYGFEHLKRDEFNPALVSNEDVVHRRFLACVLRVGDVLENDPERTPAVLFEHRGIRSSSEIYWQKDHYLNVKRDGDHLAVFAEPDSAAIEKAIRTTIDWIQAELSLCVQLASERPFGQAPFATIRPLPHEWKYPSVIVPTIRPKSDYVYIEGSFRPNTRKLLELLSGVELYKNPLVAVRELLQNAFDAVREAIAVERLREIERGLAPSGEDVANGFFVDLRLENRPDGRTWLVCRDNGIGMNRVLIERYMLVSGSSRRHEIEELDRRCRAKGFRMGRTGKFGIGVLSYFMLADRVEFVTLRRRHPIDHSSEESGWRFTTGGIGSFGELRKISARQVNEGCEVALRVRKNLPLKGVDGDEVADAPKQLPSVLMKYIREAIVRTPCRLRLDLGPTCGCKSVTISGWALDDAARDDAYRVAMRASIGDALFGERSAIDRLRERNSGTAERMALLDEITKRVIERTRWTVRELGDEQDGALARFHVPHVMLDRGMSVAVLLDDPAFGDLGIQNRPIAGAMIGGDARMAWRGVRVDLRQIYGSLQGRGAYVEVDYTDEKYGSPDVSRDALSYSALTMGWLNRLATEVRSARANLVPPDSGYATLSAAICHVPQERGPITWYHRPVGEKHANWSQLRTHAILGTPLNLQNSTYGLIDGTDILELSDIHVYSEEDDDIVQAFEGLLADRMCLCSLGDRPVDFVSLVSPGNLHPGAFEFPSPLRGLLALMVPLRDGERESILNKALVPGIQGAELIQYLSDHMSARRRMPVDASGWSPSSSLRWLLGTAFYLTSAEIEVIWHSEEQREALIGILKSVGEQLAAGEDFGVSTLIPPGFIEGESVWRYRRLSSKGFEDSTEEANRLLKAVQQEPEYNIIAAPRNKARKRKGRE
jgi:hypothetical protein